MLVQEDVDIVVEHRERLVRFGFEYIESAIAPRRVVVLDSAEMDDDLVRDVTDVLTSLCARLYGKRSARNRARKAVSACVSTD
jgi:predicted site-specific integrase-resolvase